MVAQEVRRFPAFYETRWFIAVLTTRRRPGAMCNTWLHISLLQVNNFYLLYCLKVWVCSTFGCPHLLMQCIHSYYPYTEAELSISNLRTNFAMVKTGSTDVVYVKHEMYLSVPVKHIQISRKQ